MDAPAQGQPGSCRAILTLCRSAQPRKLGFPFTSGQSRIALLSLAPHQDNRATAHVAFQRFHPAGNRCHNGRRGTAACHSGPMKVRLSSQRLDERLQDMTRKTGCPVATADQIPVDRQLQALSGRYTAMQLYSRALRNTGIALRAVGDHFEMHGPPSEQLRERD